MEIKISSYMMSRFKKFADDRIEGSEKLYKARGESKVEKMREDILAGCMGEQAIYMMLKSQSLPCTKPDLAIYKGRQKSFKADLVCEGLNIHVKSQTIASAEKYGYSWLLQRSDKLTKAPDKNDYLAFCCVDILANTVSIKGYSAASAIAENNLWEECKVAWFRRTKVALYLSHLEDNNIVINELPIGGE